MPLLEGARYALLAGGGVEPGPPMNGLTLWLSADAVTGLTDGQSIAGATIPDRSGNSRNFTGAAGTWEAGELNGYPVLQNLASSVLMSRASANIVAIFGTNACTTFAVHRADSGDATHRVVYQDSGNLNINWSWSGRIYWVHQQTAGSGVSMNQVTPASWLDNYRLLEVIRNGADGGVYYDNGVELIKETDTAGDLAAAAATLQLWPDCYGQMAEILVYARTLTDAERVRARMYLKDKYALW